MLASLLFHTRVPHKILLHSKIGFHHLIFNAFAHSSVCVKLLLHISKHVWQLIKYWAAFLPCDTSYVELGFTFSHQGWGLMQKKKGGRGLNCLGGPKNFPVGFFIFISPHPHKCLWMVPYLIWIPFGWGSKSIFPTFTPGATWILLHKI